ncbi:hypothetical protein RchiOBHm_Chr7g0180921 [Rosa chinensis]|uniref:Uncharacterized protein n=1 Tax=Rosa chinensis TaxID=74649 RepID=A0A2P6P2J7_ROSCH|nr:hypothetical protein RchiOBHm_Chr7g0180921 [Rosa chinensis]
MFPSWTVADSSTLVFFLFGSFLSLCHYGCQSFGICHWQIGVIIPVMSSRTPWQVFRLPEKGLKRKREDPLPKEKGKATIFGAETVTVNC